MLCNSCCGVARSHKFNAGGVAEDGDQGSGCCYRLVKFESGSVVVGIFVLIRSVQEVVEMGV